MAKSKHIEPVFAPPSPSRQIAFHQLLVAARKTWLVDALTDALGTIDPTLLKDQIVQYVPANALKLLASAGVRDEQVFPVPIVIEAKPTLVGYYRLLLGASQKVFYSAGTGMTPLKGMEMRGTMGDRQKVLLPPFCTAMCRVLSDLVVQLSPSVTPRDVAELRLLTLGSQFQGRNNNTIGQQATANVFLVIAEIVKSHVTDRTDRQLTLKNASGRKVIVSLATDPDVRIQEEFGKSLRNKIAIEIKGGTDRSNAHNRAGEAEKSHQKARKQDFRDCWTLIALKGLDVQKLRHESPTTNSWFDVAQVLARKGADFEEFQSRLADVVGIPLNRRSAT